MRGQKETRPCANCGALLTRLVSQARGQNWYCNAQCQAKHVPSPITVSRVHNPLRGVKETRPCVLCGNPVTRYLSQVGNRQVWTCSRTCKGILQTRERMAAGTQFLPTKPKRGESRPCEVCGTAVYRNKSQAEKGEGRYCSVTCHNLGQTKEPVLKECAQCGTELRLKPSQSAIQYCSRACQSLGRIKRPLGRLHNGRPAKKDQSGYVMLWEPEHPNKVFNGWQYEHRLVAEQSLGRFLRSDEHVHHVNETKDDNRPENLEVMSQNDHAIISSRQNIERVQRERDELAEYRRRFGPLEAE